MLVVIGSVLAATVVPPPIVIPVSEQRMVMWMPGPAQCAGSTQTPVSGRRPYNMLTRSDGANLKPVEYTFAIDASGRPVSIARNTEGGANEQAGSALAASRFALGERREDCSISYVPVAKRLEDTPVVELQSYMMTNQRPRLPEEGLRKVFAGDECRRATQPLMRAYPDFSQVDATPGVRDWEMVGFDVDSEGRTQDVRNVGGTGNDDLEEAAREAVEETRFNEGPLRRNCTYPYWRGAGLLPAPDMPPSNGDERPECRDDEWATPPKLVYPEAYRARSIEGWAILHFDIAPWGEVGNVSVVAAEPSDDFGQAAKFMLERASKPEGAGAVGCEARVAYRIRADGADDSGESAAAS
ncbi:MAG: energy transducer TonB [Erythrobacter sp.]|nr:energy transducer TonB [Erythrobacter sp.]